MNKEEMILAQQDVVLNLVKKYNNYKKDDDLISIGMMAVVKAVNKSFDEGLTDPEKIRARCVVWVRNAILDEIYRQKIDYVDFSTLDECADNEDLRLFIDEVNSQLTDKQKEVFSLLLEGKNQEEIEKELNIVGSTYYKHIQNIKKIIKSEV